jgi:hypothetical protein
MVPVSDNDFEFTEEELTELALATPYSDVIDLNAAPWTPSSYGCRSALPDWYMAPAVGVRNGRGRKVVVCALIGGFLVINALGFCITSGFLTLA